MPAHKNPNKIDDKELITLPCADCGKEYQLTYGRYRRFKKDPTHVFRCHDCYLAYQVKSKKEAYASMSEVEQQKWQQKMYTARQNRSDEAKAMTSKKISDIKKAFWESKDDEYRLMYGKLIKDRISRMSDAEYQKWCNNISTGMKGVWDKLSHEERLAKMEPVFRGSKTFWGSITDEEKQAIYKDIGEKRRKAYENMTDDEFNAWREKLSKSRIRVWNSLNDTQKLVWMKHLWNNQKHIGPTEFRFIDDLNNAGLIELIDYKQEFSTHDDLDKPFEHPEYRKIYGYVNPVTGRWITPYHKWDFVIYTASGKNDILVDIDGSSHDPQQMHFRRRGNKYTEREMIDFNDSQRPYQIPDGFDAYVIECYTDKLLDESKVKCLSGSVKESCYSDFRNIIIDSIKK